MAVKKRGGESNHTLPETFILVIIIVCGTASFFIQGGKLFSAYFWINLVLCLCFAVESILSLIHIISCGSRMARKEQYGFIDLVRYSIGLVADLILVRYYFLIVISKF